LTLFSRTDSIHKCCRTASVPSRARLLLSVPLLPVRVRHTLCTHEEAMRAFIVWVVF
jgi:hypothetical protein